MKGPDLRLYVCLQEIAGDPSAYSATAGALAAVLPLVQSGGTLGASSQSGGCMGPLPRACHAEHALQALQQALVCHLQATHHAFLLVNMTGCMPCNFAQQAWKPLLNTLQRLMDLVALISGQTLQVSQPQDSAALHSIEGHMRRTGALDGPCALSAAVLIDASRSSAGPAAMKASAHRLTTCCTILRSAMPAIYAIQHLYAI